MAVVDSSGNGGSSSGINQKWTAVVDSFGTILAAKQQCCSTKQMLVLLLINHQKAVVVDNFGTIWAGGSF